MLRPVALVLLLLTPALAQAQTQAPPVISADVLFFGDNTEFRNPFREGETIFGAAARAALELALGERVTLVAGGFGVRQFGSDRGFDLARPVLALRIASRHSTFIFGTLDSPRAVDAQGPDRAGPHGLIPPLQRETLAFERPYEAGLQWKLASPSASHDAWINWQRLNTPAHRERFDVGIAGEARITRWLGVPYQAHIVHEGGQLFASGPVADSWTLASGAVATARARKFQAEIETLGVYSRYVPDREVEADQREGSGLFARMSGERAGWRAHAIFWRGWRFVKAEGDPNYMSLTRGGADYRGTRDYSEAGLTRTFAPAPEANVETSARLHRVEGRYEYSFRILGRVILKRRLS